MQSMNERREADIIQRARSTGSTAMTVLGAARWLLKNGLPPVNGNGSLRIIREGQREGWLCHRALDRARVGDKLQMQHRSGYRVQAVPCGHLSLLSRVVAQRRNPRKKNLYAGNPRVYGEALQEREETINYKGSFKGWTGSEIFADYQSCLAASPSGRSAVVVQGCRVMRRILAPAGMAWDVDEQGIMLRRVSDGMDYHPTANDLQARNFATIVRRSMASNWRQRQVVARAAREEQRVEKIKAREIGSVRVTLEDSRRAGNCVEGSLRYAETKLGLTRDAILAGSYLFSVPASRLLKVNGHSGVARAVQIAWQRETTVSI